MSKGALTAESLRRLAELGTRSPLYGPGIASVSKSEYARSVAASVDLVEHKDDWDVSSNASTEVVIFDNPGPRSHPPQPSQQQIPPLRRAMTDVGDDDDDADDNKGHAATRQRRRASECPPVALDTLINKPVGSGRRRHSHYHQVEEPKSEFLRNRLQQARAELLHQHKRKHSVAGSTIEAEGPSSSVSGGSSSSTSRKHSSSLHYRPEKPAYLPLTGGMPDWDADVAAIRSASSSSRPPSTYMAYKPAERIGSPDIVDLTCSGSLNGGSVPATPIDPEAMWPEDCPPSVPPSPSPVGTTSSSKSSIKERGRRLSRIRGRSRSNSRSSQHRRLSSSSLAPFMAAVSSALRSPSTPSTSTPPKLSCKPSTASSKSSASSSIYTVPSMSSSSSCTKRGVGEKQQQPIQTPSPMPSPNPTIVDNVDEERGRRRSRSRSRSRSPGAGSYIENPTARRSYIDRMMDYTREEANKHLVRAGRRPQPSFRVRSVSRSDIEDIARWQTGGGGEGRQPTQTPVSPPRNVGAAVGVGASREAYWKEQGQKLQKKKLQRPAAVVAPYRAGDFDRIVNDVPYRAPAQKASDELFGIAPARAASGAGLFEKPLSSKTDEAADDSSRYSATAEVLQYYQDQDQDQEVQKPAPCPRPRRESAPKLIIDTKLTASPATMAPPAAIYRNKNDDDDNARAPKMRKTNNNSVVSSQPLRRQLDRNDSLFLGSDISAKLGHDSFFPPRPVSAAVMPAPVPGIQQQHLQPQFKAYKPLPPLPPPQVAPVELEAIPARQSVRIVDDDSILPDRPLDLGVRRPSNGEAQEDEDDRGVLPSQVSRQRSPSPALTRQRRTLNRKAGNRNLR